MALRTTLHLLAQFIFDLILYGDDLLLPGFLAPKPVWGAILGQEEHRQTDCHQHKRYDGYSLVVETHLSTVRIVISSSLNSNKQYSYIQNL